MQDTTFTFFVFLTKDLLIYFRGRVTEKSREREKSSSVESLLKWPQQWGWARQNQEPRTSPRSPKWMVGTQALGPSSAAYQVH